MSQQIQITGGAKVRNLEGVLTGTAGVVNALGINVPSGIPQLDGSGKILVSQLPNSVMEYKGTWNAATNTPTLANGTGNQGDVYLVSVAGTVNFGAGPITFAVGDQVIYSGTIWQKAGGSTGTVTSVSVTETGDALTITGSPITTSGTINIGFAGTSGQYVNGAGGLTTFPSLTGYVPYTGATANVNLGEFGLSGGYIGLDTTPTSTPTTLGTMSWDSFYLTPKVITGVGDTTLQIGQEEVLLVHNNTGSTLSDGQVVYVTGSTGELPSVSLADASSETTSAATLGVVTESIANGTNGFITVSGIVHGLNTLAFNEGDLLWLSETAGQFTNVKPISPAHLVLIGYVIKKAGGNGSILVKIQNTQELKECSDVLFTSLANNDILAYESSTQLWKNKTIPAVLGYTPQAQLNGTGFVKATGTTISYDNSTYLTTSSAASTYVPYTGATTNVNIGSNLFSAATIRVDGDNTSNFGYLGFKQFSGGNSGLNGYTSIYAQGAGSINIAFSQSGGNKTIAFLSNLISNSTTRSYSFPDADGTIALTSNLGAYLPLTGGTLSGALNVNVNSGTGLNVATENVVFRASPTYGFPRQLVFSMGSGPTTTLEAKGFGANYITDFNIRTYNSAGTGFDVFFGTSAGDVGIGNTAPAAKLDVNGSVKGSQFFIGGTPSNTAGFTNSFYAESAFPSLTLKNTSGTASWYTLGAASAGAFGIWNNTTLEYGIYITSASNIGVGTTNVSSLAKLDILLNATAVNGLQIRTSDAGTVDGSTTANVFRTVNSGAGNWANARYNAWDHIFTTASSSERMRITSGGQVQIKQAGNSFADGLRLINTSNNTWTTLAGGDNDYYFGYNGSAAAKINSAGTYTAFSDRNRKKDFEESTIGLNAVLGLKPTLYRIKTDDENADKQLGFIAQEVKEFIPQAYSESINGDETFIGLNYNAIVAALVKSVQELKAEIDELKNK